jgi:rod shape-determining protein MreB
MAVELVPYLREAVTGSPSELVFPRRDGAMYPATTQLEAVLRRAVAGRFPRPRVLITIASGSSPVERRALEEAVTMSGGRQVTLVEEPLAAAIGAGLPIQEPVGSLVVDIGGARSEMAVVSMGGIVSGQTVMIGGFDLDVAIQDRRAATYGVAIGERAADGQARGGLGLPDRQRQGGAGREPRPGTRWSQARRGGGPTG